MTTEKAIISLLFSLGFYHLEKEEGGVKMINKKNKALGCLLKALVGERCFFDVRREKYRDTVLRVYDNEEDINLNYPRWSVLSRTGYSDLIVYGDITETGEPIFDVTAKEIFSLYKKWVEEGKPEKEYTKKIRALAEPDELKRFSVGFDDYDENDTFVKPTEEELEKERKECEAAEEAEALATDPTDPDNYWPLAEDNAIGFDDYEE